MIFGKVLNKKQRRYEHKRIKEIQKETAYPDSISVYKALLKVWNECKQEQCKKDKNLSK